MFTSLAGVLLFIGDVWALMTILQGKATVGVKALWCLLVLFLPALGLILWYFAGPKSKRFNA